MEGLSNSRTARLQEQSTKTVLKSHIEPSADIEAERRKATFDVQSLKHFMAGGKHNYDKKMKFAELIMKTDWGDKSQRYFVSREQEYVNGLKAAFGMYDLLKANRMTLQDGYLIRRLVASPGGLELHIGMFIPALLGQASPEQRDKWLPLAQDNKIIGTYAQTELGHGSFVRGLQTTATYDKASQQFIIHTPTETATKWWPGGLGKTATHVVLMARLFIDGTDYGPHGFIVQVRSLDTHRALPGVTVGDIGPKFGYNAVDNGFLSFDHVCIPLDHMLMRYAKVTPDGHYIKPPPSNSKASYATMVFVRANLVDDAAVTLAKAAAISVRYCCVRRQGAIQPGMNETKLMDYQNVGSTLIPILAAAYALQFTSQKVLKMYGDFERSRDKGDFRILPELHAMSSGMKAVCSWETVEGIERCRFCCGGHGYSRLSGLPDLYMSYVQNPTWEGDNDVLCLQTGRYLLKAVTGLPRRGIEGSARYLQEFLEGKLPSRCLVKKESDWMSSQSCLEALQYRTVFLCREAEQKVRIESNGRLEFNGPGWNKSTVSVIKAATAHCWSTVAANFMEALDDIRSRQLVEPSIVDVLDECCTLFALNKIERFAADLLESGYMDAHQIKLLRGQKDRLIEGLRPNAVPLADGFGFLDYELNSALGREDGDVYKGLLEMAKASPLNKTEEGPGWKTVLEPRLRPKSRL